MYKTLSEIKKELRSGSKLWRRQPDPRFELGEVYSVRLLGRKDCIGVITGQVVYSVKNYLVKLRSEDCNSELYIYPNDELEIV